MESKRNILARDRKLDELKVTYSTKILLENKNTGDFWDNKFSSTHEKKLKNFMEIDRNNTAAKWFSDIVTEEASTLNVGCGDGNFESLISKLNVNFSHTGVDLAQKSLDKLTKKFPRFRFDKRDILARLHSNDKNAYEIVSIFEVLEHISPIHTFQALGNLSNMLKKDGYLLVSVPMNEGLENMFPNNPNEHLRCYLPELIFAELTIAGFKILRFEVFYAFSKLYFLKKFIAKYILQTKWQPNNILILCRKT